MENINIEVEFEQDGYSHPDELLEAGSDIYELVEDLTEMIHQVCEQHQYLGNFFIYFGGKDADSQFYKVSSDNVDAEAKVAEEIARWYEE